MHVITYTVFYNYGNLGCEDRGVSSGYAYRNRPGTSSASGVLFSGLKVSSLLDPTTDAFRNSLERHYLFPKDWLKKNGFPEIYQTNQIANYALIEWPDNSDISAQSPADYWPQFKDRYTKPEWPTIRYWHALPENWEKMNYEDFLKKRRGLIAQVIRDGFEKI